MIQESDFVALRIKINLALTTTEQGGRHSAIDRESRSGYRASHHFPWQPPRDNYMGIIIFEPRKGVLRPGESCDTEAVIWIPKAELAKCVPRLQWQVVEGARVTASATLLSVISAEPN